MKKILQGAFVLACVLVAATTVRAEDCNNGCYRVDQFGRTVYHKGGFKSIDDVLYSTDRYGRVQYQKDAYKDIDDVLYRVDRYGRVQEPVARKKR